MTPVEETTFLLPRAINEGKPSGRFTQDPEYVSFDHVSSNIENLEAVFSVFAPLCHIKAHPGAMVQRRCQYRAEEPCPWAGTQILAWLYHRISLHVTSSDHHPVNIKMH